MKWALLAAATLTIIFGLPFREYETGQLLPIKSICAEYEQNVVHIVSEVAQGRGESWADAVEDLKRNASGDVFFDTAEYLVVTNRMLAHEAKQDLRPSAQVFFVKTLPPTQGLYEYLKAHPSDLELRDLEGA